MTPQQKRRVREANLKRENEIAALDEIHQHALANARQVERLAGFEEGRKAGAKATRDAVLDHAGRFYKEDKDDAARAVRDVYKLLAT